MRRLMLTAAVIVAIPALSYGATLRVPKDHPTIQEAADAASDGDTIAVSRGVYVENVVVTKNRLRFIGKQAVWDGAPGGSKGDCLHATGDGILVQGFRMRNGGVEIDGNDATVTRCVIRSADGDGVEIDGDGASVAKNTIRGCYVGIDIDGDDALVTKNTVTNMDDGGIEVDGNGAEIVRNTVKVIEDGEGIEVSGNDAEVVRNTVSNTDYDSIDVSGDRAVVEKNRCSAAGDYLLYVSGDAFRVVRNRVWNAIDDSDGVRLTTSSKQGGGLAERNFVSDVVEDAFVLSGDNVTLRNNRVLDSGSEDDEAFDVSGDGNTLEGCQAIGAEGDAFDISGDGNKLTKCKAIDAMEDGFDISGVGNQLIDCLAKACDAEGLDNEGTQTVVRGGKFLGCCIDIACDALAGASFATFAPARYDTGGEDTQPMID